MKLIRTVILFLLPLVIVPAGATETIRFIIPTTPGGGVDGFFRVLAKDAELNLGSHVVVVNLCSAGSCAGGTTGVSKLVQAVPDGYTLAGVWLGPITVAPHSLPVTYQPTDYVPVIQLTSAPYAVCTRANFPVDTGSQLIDALRAKPDAYTYGTDGFGNGAHLAMTRIFNKLGISQRDVPFKGSGETLAAMLGGHIDIYVGSLPPIIAHVRAGRAKCQMLTSARKVAQLPQASSLDELGLAQEETLLWRGIIAPKGTPEARIRELETAFEAAVNAPATRAYVEAAGEQIVIYKSEEFRRRIDAEYEQFGKLSATLRSR